MPIYEYKCKECDKIYEVMQGFEDEPLEKCEKCGGLLEKILSKSNFQLKGDGWYKDGYNGPSNKSPD